MPLKRETGRRRQRALDLAGQSTTAVTDASTVEVSSYVAAMLSDLIRLAGGKNLTMLAHFLGMAHIEAESLAHSTADGKAVNSSRF